MNPILVEAVNFLSELFKSNPSENKRGRAAAVEITAEDKARFLNLLKSNVEAKKEIFALKAQATENDLGFGEDTETDTVKALKAEVSSVKEQLKKAYAPVQGELDALEEQIKALLDKQQALRAQVEPTAGPLEKNLADLRAKVKEEKAKITPEALSKRVLPDFARQFIDGLAAGKFSRSIPYVTVREIFNPTPAPAPVAKPQGTEL